MSVSSRIPLPSTGCSGQGSCRMASAALHMAYTALTPFSGLAEWAGIPKVSTTISARPRWPIFRSHWDASPMTT